MGISLHKLIDRLPAAAIEGVPDVFNPAKTPTLTRWATVPPSINPAQQQKQKMVGRVRIADMVIVVVVVVVLTLTRIIKSVVTGQAPVTLEWRNTP